MVPTTLVGKHTGNQKPFVGTKNTVGTENPFVGTENTIPGKNTTWEPHVGHLEPLGVGTFAGTWQYPVNPCHEG
jgi:hypothetical protein